VGTTCGQQYTLFNAEKINGEFEAVRLPDNGCEWDISQLYSKGVVQELAFEEFYLKGSQTVSQFRATPVVQNQSFYVGFRYYPAPDEAVPFTPILRIFDAMGQLHLETPVTLYAENTQYQYYRIHIQPNAFYRMAVGVYVMTISDQNTLKSKVKMSVFPQKIEN
jgi:hypothetical protein